MEDAAEYTRTGLELKAKGQTDAALTAFRRAAIIDPKCFPALMEIGYLCREKAKRDRIFLRHTFEAFRQAVKLELENEEAHNQYIMAGQQMGMLDSLMMEYGEWIKRYPENQVIQRCHKNIMAISMAMMPQAVNVASASGSLRKPLMIASILALVGGIGFMVAGPLLLKSGKIKAEQVAGLVRIGFFMEASGVAGFIIRSRM